VGDWLEEAGEIHRAEFIRLQCEAERRTTSAERRSALLGWADELLAEHEHEWLGDWYNWLIRWEFRRGFVWSVRLTAGVFLHYGEELFQSEPVGRVEIVDDAGGPLSEELMREVVASPVFRFVQDCAVVTSRFSHREEGRVNAWLHTLAAASHVTRLRAFGPEHDFGYIYDFWTDAGIDRAALEAFCQAPHLHTLTSLHLNDCPIRSGDKDRLAEAIAEAPFAANLRRLRLPHCRLTERGITRIATDPVFRNL